MHVSPVARGGIGRTTWSCGIEVCVVTGGASGIGRALAARFVAEGARAVVVVDRDADGVQRGRGGARVPSACRPTSPARSDVLRVIDDTETRCGPIDLFCSNAGILRRRGRRRCRLRTGNASGR